MIPLSETQSLILSRAAARPGNLALPLPDSLRGGAAAKVVEALLAKGLVEEVEANIRRSEPLWRETGDGHGTTLLATEAGLAAVGIEPLVAGAIARGKARADGAGSGRCGCSRGPNACDHPRRYQTGGVDRAAAAARGRECCRGGCHAFVATSHRAWGHFRCPEEAARADHCRRENRRTRDRLPHRHGGLSDDFLNCLPEHETLGEFARRECVESIDIRFCRNDAEAGAGEAFIATCAPAEAEFATIYGITDLGEARAIHDVDLDAAGADELAAACRALFVAISLPRGAIRLTPPSAIRRNRTPSVP